MHDVITRAICCPHGTCISPGYWSGAGRMAKKDKPVQIHADLGATGPAALARPVIDTEIKTRGHGKIVARQAIDWPPDVHHHHGRLDDVELAAAQQLRRALASMRAPRVTARIAYGSDEGLDDEAEDLTDEQREEQRRARFRDQVAARDALGPLWHAVAPVVEAVSWSVCPAHDLAALRRGLRDLARMFKIRGGENA